MEKQNKTNNTDNMNNEELLHTFQPGNTSFFSKKLIAALCIAILLGAGSGYFLSQKGGAGGLSKTSQGSSSIAAGTVVGSEDTNTFKDIAEGELQEGGIDGEGQFHLVRPGGESQNVYLTSSSVDLSQFMNKKIKVWGQTQKAQHAGWLMDVGRVEVRE